MGNTRLEADLGNPIHRRVVFIAAAPLPALDCCTSPHQSRFIAVHREQAGLAAELG